MLIILFLLLFNPIIEGTGAVREDTTPKYGASSSIILNLHSKDESGNTKLHIASQKEDYDLVKALIFHGANPNELNNDGYSPLLFAFLYENVEIIQFFLDNGADIHTESNSKEGVIHVAVRTKNLEVLELSLEYGADIDKQNKSGNTALHDAAINNNSGAVKLLVENGADVSIKNKQGYTALDLAKQSLYYGYERKNLIISTQEYVDKKNEILSILENKQPEKILKNKQLEKKCLSSFN